MPRMEYDVYRRQENLMNTYTSRKTTDLAAICLTILMAAACSPNDTKSANDIALSETLTQTILNADGAPLGSLMLEDLGAQGTKITVSVSGVSPGAHAMHFHEIGQCDAPDFKSSGGHYNPTDMSHGHKMPNGPHAGDMMNVEVAADGTGTFIVTNDRVSINGNHGLPALMDEDGTALILHAGEDDYVSQPTGAAGGRIGCAVVGG